MQINKSLLKRDVENLEIRKLIEERKIDNIDGDWIRITDYFSFDKEVIYMLVNKYKRNYGSLAPTISLALLLYGIGLEKRETYMKEEKDWEYVKKMISRFPFDEYYDYENRIYDINVKTLKLLNQTHYLRLKRNDFIHLQTWVLAVYLAKLEENGCTFHPVRENGILVGLSIDGNKENIKRVEEEIKKDYGVLFDLNAGWFLYI
ncbi:hypothetical protein [Sulfurisphaera ohwakuensis]|uniref:Uncharacterized protein n=1 Tax=Sulfurisphaera ohwakuensis TaxID=69656 RepID=A0A650CFD5_SULOH|nr:hypothetical protein [Sulfurisphaera ohwakuensis]MBB5254148.1 hypothetical protein [Sulfurisphaera ohwakuensis]QGR16524.1 hypothetical protein D1869_04420 [Sulfurisphaera ohwakuensis]